MLHLKCLAASVQETNELDSIYSFVSDSNEKINTFLLAGLLIPILSMLFCDLLNFAFVSAEIILPLLASLIFAIVSAVRVLPNDYSHQL